MTTQQAAIGMGLIACTLGSTAFAQEARSDASSEGSGIVPRTVSWAESKFDWMSGAQDGFSPELGEMITGAGFSIGPAYRQHVLGGRAIVDLSAATSQRGYKMMQSRIEWPQLFTDRLSLGGQIKYQDFTQINFFGVGNASSKDDQTDYRLNDIDAVLSARVRIRPWLSLSGRGGMLRSVNVERGTGSSYPSTGDRFDDLTAPGISQQPDYLHADVAIEADTRDVAGYPSSGGRYRAALATFHDRVLSRNSFSRVEVEATKYIPIAARSVVSIRGRTDVSLTSDGEQVPFYLLPALGSPNTLRGYPDYRFRDRDLVLLGVEYRWPLLGSLDAAAFYDAGAVAPTVSALASQPLRHDYGAGVRLHTSRRLLGRFDMARSPEGWRAILSFAAPLAFSKHSIMPFVP